MHNWEVPNVLDQDNDPDSMLNHYRALIHLRKNNDALRFGTTTPVSFANSSILAYERAYENDTILVIMNLYFDEIPGTYDAETLSNMEILFQLGDHRIDAENIAISARGIIIARIPG